jgi:major intracellular serine protease
MGDIEDNDWHIRKFGIDKIWLETKGKGVTIAILDSGISDHPDINPEFIIDSRNFLYNGNDEEERKKVPDRIGHGTHCAGIICAQGIKAFGVAPEADLMVGKIVDTSLGSDPSAFVNGLEWAYRSHADVISVSVNPDDLDDGTVKKIENLDQQFGGILVGALNDAGDMGFDVEYYPYKFSTCLGVGAVDPDFMMDPLTCRSSNLDLLAPGHGIYSTWTGNGYETLSGCSMAAPFVAGVLALAISYLRNKKRTYHKAELVSTILKATTHFASYQTLPGKQFPVIDPVFVLNELKKIL